MWLRLASTCGSATWVDTLAGESDGAALPWVRQRVEALAAQGTFGPLYLFIRQPPDAALAETLAWVVADRRLQPIVVAEAAALAAPADLGRLERAGARALFVTLDNGADGAAPAAVTQRWRGALAVLTAAPRLAPRLRVGLHLMLSATAADDLPRALRLLPRLGNAELLLWDGGGAGLDGGGLSPAEARRALDFAVTTAQRFALRLHAVGFERVPATLPSAAATPGGAHRANMPPASTRRGRPAPAGATDDGVSSAWALAQRGFARAAAGAPELALPACLGGPPPPLAAARPAGHKHDACRACPMDADCRGLPESLAALPGLDAELRPPAHWRAAAHDARVLVLCPVLTDKLYGTTFFSLARALARRGARVDLVSPWAFHSDVTPTFHPLQPFERPADIDMAERFVREGAVEAYDLVIAPDLRVARTLVEGHRLRADTRLAATDFHLLWGMDDWVRDVCPAGQRPEAGGWWPSEQLVLYSAFPGYARLYTRYGVPLRQVVWQPYALDPATFRAERPPAAGAAIISAGRHLRDLDTLLAAAARLADEVHPIDLYAEGALPNPPRHIRFLGTVESTEFCPAVGNSRFMVVPLHDDAHRAAGIMAIATGIMYGRPIVASATAATRDYVVDGVNGLLVPPGDAAALAEAITRLDTDAALLARLSAGAQTAAQQLTTDRWAERLLRGAQAPEWTWNNWRLRQAAGQAAGMAVA